jgi:hypothetical protein
MFCIFRCIQRALSSEYTKILEIIHANGTQDQRGILRLTHNLSPTGMSTIWNWMDATALPPRWKMVYWRTKLNLLYEHAYIGV